jgi:hypothetical protein
MEPRFRLVFTGRLIQGVEPEQAIAALNERFQVREPTARQMIRGGGRHVLKHDLGLERARRYRAALGEIGLVTELEPQGPEGEPALDTNLSIQVPVYAVASDPGPAGPGAPEPVPGSTPCPKCGAVAVSPVTGVCDACGVVAERYLARLAEEGRGVRDAGGGSGPQLPHPPSPVDPDPLGAETDDALCDPCSVAAGRGWGWIGDAWSQFRGQPWTWVGALLLFMLVSMALGLVPLVGGLALGILGPMLSGGLMIGAHTQRGGGRFEIAHLLAGFSRNPGGLALVGAAYLGLSLLLGLLIVLALATGVSLLAPDLSALELATEPMDPGALGSLGPLSRSGPGSAPTLGRLAGAGGLEGGHQVALAVADQVRAAHGLERLAQQRPVLRVVVAQEGLVQAPLAPLAHHRHRSARRSTRFSGLRPVWYMAEAVAMGVGRKAWTWSGRKPLRLSQSARSSMSSSRGPGVGGDEVGDQVLLLARLPRVACRTGP